MIKVMVNDLSDGFLRISFIGKLPNDESVNMYAEYKDGEMAVCSAAYSSMSSPDYYIWISEVFKKIKELEGEKIKEIENKIINDIKEDEILLNEVMNEYSKALSNCRKDQDQINELNKKLNRFRNKQKIEETNNLIKELEDELNEKNIIKEQIRLKYKLISNKIREKMKFQIDEINF